VKLLFLGLWSEETSASVADFGKLTDESESKTVLETLDRITDEIQHLSGYKGSQEKAAHPPSL